ncbi:MAG: glutamate--tRNA ligase [Chloroflexota bacterium]|nr:glutamate--tRNA ligase [Chloroflexota bacterium]
MPPEIQDIRVRMAPSPTGPLHVGTARTSLYNHLLARHTGGTYVLRIEDTDRARSTVEHERDIIDNLHWLGITWDEGPQVAGGDDIGPFGPYRQSQRAELYAAEVQRLLDARSAYRCYCTPEQLEAVHLEQEHRHEPPRYNGRCRDLTDVARAELEAAGRRAAIRFRVPAEVVRFSDLVRGEVEFDNALLGDFVIVRADGVPLYNFVVVVDDAAMQISHVIRGEDHLSNTPKQIALLRALGYREPVFGHIPLILNPDRSKMSKRKSQTSITAYREQGYLPEAMVNFLAFLGWSPGTEEEIFTLPELADRFEIEHVHKAGAVFDLARLDHLNGVYIRSLTDEQLALRLRPFLPDALEDRSVLAVAPLVKERLVRLGDVTGLVGFLFEPDATVATWYEAEELHPKGRGAQDAEQALNRLQAAIEPLPDTDWAADLLETRAREVAAEMAWKPGDLFKPLRVAITGRTVSPPLFGSMELLGRDRCMARIDEALRKLEAEPVGASPATDR